MRFFSYTDIKKMVHYLDEKKLKDTRFVWLQDLKEFQVKEVNILLVFFVCRHLFSLLEGFRTSLWREIQQQVPERLARVLVSS